MRLLPPLVKVAGTVVDPNKETKENISSSPALSGNIEGGAGGRAGGHVASGRDHRPSHRRTQVTKRVLCQTNCGGGGPGEQD